METEAGTRNVALDGETRILDAAGGALSSADDFSLVLGSGTRVRIVADMESADTGTALEIRVGGPDD